MPLYYDEMPIKADDINAELESLGYHYHVSPLGGHHVSALYGHAFNKYFETDDDLNFFIDRLKQSNEWELHYATGNVDVDVETGTITPRDGSAPYSASMAAEGYSGGNHFRPTSAAEADFISAKFADRPHYGGNWYKVRPSMRILPKSN